MPAASSEHDHGGARDGHALAARPAERGDPPQAARVDQREPQSHAGRRAEHDGRQLERSVGGDEVEEVVPVRRGRHVAEDGAENGRIVDGREQPADAEKQPEGETPQADAGVVPDVEAGHGDVVVRIAVRRSSARIAPPTASPSSLPITRLAELRVGVGEDAGQGEHAPENEARQPQAVSQNSRRGIRTNISRHHSSNGRCGRGRAGCGPGPRVGGDTGSWPAETGRRRPGPGRRRPRDTGRPGGWRRRAEPCDAIALPSSAQSFSSSRHCG